MRPRARNAPLSSDAILTRLARLHPKVIDLSLERVSGLMARLGDPQERLPPVVHVAGTNGKGSVIAFLRAFLEAAGYRVHAATSPHLVRFNERIRLAGRLISDDHLMAVLEECEAADRGRPITFFEITTAAAFLAFSRVPADVLLLETGLGGRLDATNLVRRPALTVLTPVSLDHQQFLGETIGQIMAEKAGILKPGVACVHAAQGRRPPAALIERAAALAVPLFGEGRDWQVRAAGGVMIHYSGGRQRRLPLPSLPGAHQVRNAGLAVACIDHLDAFAVPDAAIAAGLGEVEWPARLQRLVRGPLVESLPAGWELWLDGGHNPAAARILAAHARRWRDRPLHLILGMLSSKDPIAFLKPLEGKAADVRTVAIPGEENAIPAADLAAAAASLRLTAAAAPGVAAALAATVAADAGPARVLICGSLYLAGTVLAGNG